MRPIKCSSCKSVIRAMMTDEGNIKLACKCSMKRVYWMDSPLRWREIEDWSEAKYG